MIKLNFSLNIFKRINNYIKMSINFDKLSEENKKYHVFTEKIQKYCRTGVEKGELTQEDLTKLHVCFSNTPFLSVVSEYEEQYEKIF